MHDRCIDWIQEIPKSERRSFHDKLCYHHELFLNYSLDPQKPHDCPNCDYFPFGIFSGPKEKHKLYHLLTYITEIKDRYVLARTLFVKAQIAESDFDFLNIPYESRLEIFLDYRVGFDINTEYMKLAFLMGYSVFDKIAFLLHEYLNGTLREHDISFHKIFNRKKIVFQKKYPKERYLQAIYDIQQDLENCYPRITDLRNSLAHKYLVAHTMFEPHEIPMGTELGKNLVKNPNGDHSKENPVNFHTTVDELHNLTLHTLILARSALIYTSLLINSIENQNKDPNINYIRKKSAKV